MNLGLRCWRRALPLALTAWLLLPGLRAQNAAPQPASITPTVLKQLSLEELAQIEVTTPSKDPSPAFRATVAISVLTGEDIKRSGATTIPDALRLIPGVEVARINGSQWSVGIRGFGSRLSRSVLVLIDGRSVYTTLFAGTYWEVQDTLLQDIDRIEVIRGPGGTIWGPNAVNGVINIITKSTKDTQGTFVTTGGGNEEQGFIGARYGGGNNKNLTYRVYAKGFTRSPEYHYSGSNFDDWRGGQTGFRMDWTPSDRDSFTLQGDLYHQVDGQQVTLGNYTPPSEQTLTDNADASGGNLLARWTRTQNDHESIQVQTYYDRTNRYEPNLGERRDTFDIDVVKHQRLKDRHDLTYGIGARLSEGRFLQVGSGLVFDPANRLDYILSGFFEDNISLVNDKLTVSLGSKLLRTNFSGLAAQPSIRLLWAPSERHSAWAAFTHAIRTPSRVEQDLYLSSYLGTNAAGVAQFARFDANPDFATEQLNGFEVGYRTLLRKNLFVDISGFRNQYHDLLSENLLSLNGMETTLPFPDPTTAQHDLITAQFRNDLFGYTTGGEVAPEWRPTASLRLRASYSYLNMNLGQTAGTVIGSPASTTGASPHHEVTAQSAFDLTQKLQLDLTYRYVSSLPALSTPAYSTGDARVEWRFARGVELSVVGQNLLQPQHLEYGNPIGVRRSVYASVAWTK